MNLTAYPKPNVGNINSGKITLNANLSKIKNIINVPKLKPKSPSGKLKNFIKIEANNCITVVIKGINIISHPNVL
ncbi:hypothetical protein SHM_23040 [Spiroplasma ixodetis]|uniref:Uncharacterized protein n=1 Tax=Spiroplasma ixodetis TaxID=2141 RepID=A0ABN6T0H8_9MOLU|nr:hypothetical protein SHM_23040 [Spiroplasma ixodetis]